MNEEETKRNKKRRKRKMNEKIFAIILRMFPEKWKQVEDFLDGIGATVIFVSARAKLIL